MAWSTSRRKDRLRGSGISGWDEQRLARRILERDNHRCYRCGVRATQVDHVRPLSRGGTSADENLRAICVPCHRVKSRGEAQLARPSMHRRAEPHPGLAGGGGPPPGGSSGSMGAAAQTAYVSIEEPGAQTAYVSIEEPGA